MIRGIDMSHPWKPQAVVLGTDLTATSGVVAGTAIEIARRLDVELCILHVFQYLIHHRYRMPVSWMLEEVRRDINAKLRRLKKRAEDSQCSASTKVIESEDPAGSLLKESARFERAILVLGTHARDPIERFFLGSVAEQVLRTTRFPVITVGPHVKRRFGMGNDQLMFATDLTERSLEPIPLLAALMTPSTHLTVVHVTESVLETDARAAMDTVRARMALYLPDQAMKHQVKWKVIHSSEVTKALIEAATEDKAELLIMGMHRSGELNAHLPLKTGFQIIIGAPCAVLSVCS
ncbi:Nucleotide-binding universal stress protein, UspA family [Terriglobus roseus]|uniref:Nucleotide-binding universal stress protein, UspA family n=2 Tax=Terriglobus roseus TaxID=392734 RepID=A0A1H4KZJ3_9BACT|nr:Nucleotide-binding universal stress protein, UspA family [Terriglobus roseus]